MKFKSQFTNFLVFHSAHQLNAKFIRKCPQKKEAEIVSILNNVAHFYLKDGKRGGSLQQIRELYIPKDQPKKIMITSQEKQSCSIILLIYCMDTNKLLLKMELQFNARPENYDQKLVQDGKCLMQSIQYYRQHQTMNILIFIDLCLLLQLEKIIYAKRIFYEYIIQNLMFNRYVDGQEYFEDVHKSIQNAKKEIFITDWWLSPELYLIRPLSQEEIEIEEALDQYELEKVQNILINDETLKKYNKYKQKQMLFDFKRLDNLLISKAISGVKVYIILYKEPFVLYNNSKCKLILYIIITYQKDVKYKLEKMSKNITVLRHPLKFVFLWSHHEKTIVIDQEIGFMGGLDLCFGRMDNQSHSIFDQEFNDKNQQYFFPGIDYSNSRIKDFVDPKSYNKEEIERNTVPRMPWHDIALGLRGNIVLDISRHFIQYFNFVKYQMAMAEQKLIEQNTFLGSRVKNNWNSLKFKISNALFKGQQNKDQKQIILKGDNNIEKVKKVLSIWKLNKNKLMKEKNEQEQEKEQFQKMKTIKEIKNKEQDHLLINNIQELNNLDLKKSTAKLRKDFSSIYEQTEKEKNELLKERIHIHDFHEKQKEFPSYIPKTEQKKMKKEDLIFMSLIKFQNSTQQIQNSKQKSKKVIDPIQLSQQEKQNEFVKKFTMAGKQQNNIQPDKNFKINKTKTIMNDQFYQENMLKLSVQQEENNSEQKQNLLIPSKKQQKEDLQIQSIDLNLLSNEEKGTCKCQILRSACFWSIGLHSSNVEQSILIAYLQLIEDAMHYIYIENQFFISSTAGPTVKNKIAESLVKKIVYCHQIGQKFKVIIVMPLLPGFEGDIENSKVTAVLRIQMHWQYQTICRSQNSIYSQLIQNGIQDPSKYIKFLGLRNYGKSKEGIPQTEIVYVHSKLMIVDDQTVILGSANINDRSMLGERDSEMAIVIKDTIEVESKMNNQPFKAKKFALSLRQKIWGEIFGVFQKNSCILVDPLDDNAWKEINEQLEINTVLYRQIFKCYPDDTLLSFNNFADFYGVNKLTNQVFSPYERIDQELFNKEVENKQQIKGLAVNFPLQFLKDSDLTFSTFSKENLVAEYNFT